MANLKRLDNYIHSSPIIFQVAKDNKWEECWIIELSNTLPAKNDIEKYLSKEKYRYLAIEIQWNQSEGTYVFHLGYSPAMKIKSHSAFIRKLLEYAKEYTSFGNLIQSIDKELFGRKYLFERELDFVRVGIFNHWFSSGPIDIWEKGKERKMSIDQMKEMFRGHENLLKTDLNFQAMAFAYAYEFENTKTEIRHVLKVPSAQKVGEIWQIDFDLMLKYLVELEGFKKIKE